MDRRSFVAATTAAAALYGTGRMARAQAPAGLPEYYPGDYADIVEGSKAENNLLVYSNMSTDMWQGVLARYRELYPWITVQTLDLESAEVMERYLAESGTGSRTADILVTVAPDAWLRLIDRGQIADYASPEIPHLPGWSIPSPGLYTIAIDPMLFIYNKMLLPEELVPTSFADMVEKVRANPDLFRGKLTTYGAQFGSFGYTGTYAFVEHHGEKAWEWLETIGPLTRLERSSGPMVEKTTSGEYLLGYLTGSGNPWLAIRDPNRARILGWDFIADGTPVMMRGAAIPKASTNVNAARLWLDVMLSHAGQVGLSKGGRTPYRLDVSPEDVDGAYTYQTVIEAIGEDMVVPVTYDPAMLTAYEGFIERYRKAFGV